MSYAGAVATCRLVTGGEDLVNAADEIWSQSQAKRL